MNSKLNCFLTTSIVVTIEFSKILLLNIWAILKMKEEMLTECQLKQCGENGKSQPGG